MSCKTCLHLLLLLTFLFTVQALQAHDPGFSRTSILLDGDSVVLHAQFARADIERVVHIDNDGSGKASPTEFEQARSSLENLFATNLLLRDAQGMIPADRIAVSQLEPDDIGVTLSFQTPDTRPLSFNARLMQLLPRGHRQHLLVQGSSGELQKQDLLDAQSATVMLGQATPGRVTVFRQYLVEGIWHIWIGFDHLLFLITLLLPAVLTYQERGWRAVDAVRPAVWDMLKLVTAFTLAHSLTLSLTAFELIQLPSRWVETAIAASVLVAAANNIRPVFLGSRWILALLFGLVHGLGFAGALAELGLPPQAQLTALLGFNLGVEAGQLAVVALALPIMALLRHTAFYRVAVLQAGSLAAAVLALVWTIERGLG